MAEASLALRIRSLSLIALCHQWTKVRHVSPVALFIMKFKECTGLKVLRAGLVRYGEEFHQTNVPIGVDLIQQCGVQTSEVGNEVSETLDLKLPKSYLE